MVMSDSLLQCYLEQWLRPLLHLGLNYLNVCSLPQTRLKRSITRLLRDNKDEDSTAW